MKSVQKPKGVIQAHTKAVDHGWSGMKTVSYEEFSVLTELEMKKRFTDLDETAQREKLKNEEAADSV